nr:thioredoxin family protein [Halomarina rubra]
MGDLDAPIDIYYWSDFQCPFCHRFEQETLPELISNDVEAGRVRIVFIEHPYLGSASMTAAVADRCVWRQIREDSPETYWPWHASVFEAQGDTNSGWASKSNLLDIAADVDGVDGRAVEECMADNREPIESSIEEDLEQAGGFGVRGTPSFVLYHRPSETAGKMVGAQPYEQFETALSKLESR